MIFFPGLYAAFHLPWELQAGSEGQRGLHQMEPCLALASPHPDLELEALYITMSMAGAVPPSMGYIASKSQRGSTKLVLLSSSRNHIWKQQL